MRAEPLHQIVRSGVQPSPPDPGPERLGNVREAGQKMLEVRERVENLGQDQNQVLQLHHFLSALWDPVKGAQQFGGGEES